VKQRIPTLPNTKDLKPNAPVQVGAVAIFNYPHYAIVSKLTETGFWVEDSNFGGCGMRTHFIQWNDPHLTGFYEP
jgi:hypothetical protein